MSLRTLIFDTVKVAVVERKSVPARCLRMFQRNLLPSLATDMNDDVGSRFFLNVGKLPPDYKASHLVLENAFLIQTRRQFEVYIFVCVGIVKTQGLSVVILSVCFTCLALLSSITIFSRDLPLVSGTRKKTKAMPSAETPAKNQKVI